MVLDECAKKLALRDHFNFHHTIELKPKLTAYVLSCSVSLMYLLQVLIIYRLHLVCASRASSALLCSYKRQHGGLVTSIPDSGIDRALFGARVRAQGPVSRKSRKVFGPVKPFLDHLYLKTEKCIRL